MTRTRAVPLMFGVGAILCIPAAVAVASFAGAVADANAYETATVCAIPTRDTSSTCVSLFAGRIASEHSGGKSLRRVTIMLEDTSVDVGYGCFESPADACNFPIAAGTQVATGWWKGRLVTFGAPGVRPSVVTDLNPVDGLRNMAFWLGGTIPATSLILAAALLWQAPTTVGILKKESRPIGRLRVWRVAWGYYAWIAYPFWLSFYLLACYGFFTIFPGLSSYAPLLFVGVMVIVLGNAAWFSPAMLSNDLRAEDAQA